jgi:hypothetical protein
MMARQKLPSSSSPPKAVLDPRMKGVFLPNEIMNQLLQIPDHTWNAIALYVIYATFIQTENRIPSIEEIRKNIPGGGEHRISVARKALTENGFLKTQTIRRDDGTFVTKQTVLTSPEYGFPRQGEPYGKLLLRNNITSQQPKSAAGVREIPRSGDFERLWKQHPRKVNKVEARKAWKQQDEAKVLPPIGSLLAAHLRAIEEENWSDDRMQFIPHLSSWLRAQRWNDYSDGSPYFDARGAMLDDIREFQDECIRLEQWPGRKNIIEDPKQRASYIKWLRTQARAENGIPKKEHDLWRIANFEPPSIIWHRFLAETT